MIKGEKPTRPNTLNLLNKIDTATNKAIDNLKNNIKGDSIKTPPPPPPRWSKPTTPQSINNNNNNFTTTVMFSANSQSPKNENLPEVVVCDPKRMSPEGQCTSTVSSKGGSLRREQVTSPNGSILSPNSDPNSLLSPDTLSPLSATKTTRHSRRRHKVTEQYSQSLLLINKNSVCFRCRNTIKNPISLIHPQFTIEVVLVTKSVITKIYGQTMTTPTLKHHQLKL